MSYVSPHTGRSSADGESPSEFPRRVSLQNDALAGMEAILATLPTTQGPLLLSKGACTTQPFNPLPNRGQPTIRVSTFFQFLL